MAGGKSDYLEKAVLDHIVGGTTLAKPATVWVALSTGIYNDAATGAAFGGGGAEVTGGAYARQSLTNNATNFPNATGTSPATKSNGVAINFPTATAAWGNIQSFYILDAASGGNVLYGADLSTPKTVATGDSVSFAAGGLVITED